jgi:anti-anti-sigma regulatory factor
MLKIRRSADRRVVLTISGRLQGDNVDELSGLVRTEVEPRGLILDLTDLVIADGDAIRFLCDCERDGVVLRNCPRYISAWMSRERARP